MAPAASFPIQVGKIDDVQELRNSKPNSIPPRFLRDLSERPQISHVPSSVSRDIPVIDFSKLLNANDPEALRLAKACEDWGFFQVVNHGIDAGLVESIEELANEFFMMPLEEKQKYPMAPGTIQGYGQAFVFSEEQKLDWCNMFALGIHPHSIRNPKLWPLKPPKFSDTIEEYSREVRILCRNLLKHIARNLGLRDETFEEMFGEAVQAIRMNYYPACARPDLVMGLSPHSDGSALTVLQQGKGSYVGLQILKDNTWVPVEPIPKALVINIGDTLEVLTNGKYKSVEHRAVTHKEKNRLSIVTFYAPSYEMEVGPIAKLVDENNPINYRTYPHAEYNKHYVSNKLQGKKTLEFAKLRSLTDYLRASSRLISSDPKADVSLEVRERNFCGTTAAVRGVGKRFRNYAK